MTRRVAKQAQRRRWRARPAGMAFLAAVVLLLTAAWNTGANLLYLIMGGAASFPVIALMLCDWMLWRLTLTREAPEAAYRGQPFGVTVRLENRKRSFPTVALRLERADGTNGLVGYVPFIPAGQAAVLRMSESFPKRGVYRLPPVRVASAFPFGLFETSRIASDAVEVVVYPRIVPLRTGALDHVRGMGQVPRVIRGDGDEFFSLRPYVSGDDMRRIAWRASARLGELLVKEFELSASRYVVLVLDNRLRPDVSGFEERFEEAVELVASLAVTLLNRNYSVAVVSHSGHVAMGEGKSHAIKALDMLARVQPIAEDEAPRASLAMHDADEVLAVRLYISPDPATWGSRREGGRVLDPREVVLA